MSIEQMSSFAQTITGHKYSHTKPDTTKESWPEVAHRTGTEVCGALKIPRPIVKEIVKLIEDRIFMPGGRYLYASGRPFHQVNNCLLLRVGDSREEWADLCL